MRFKLRDTPLQIKMLIHSFVGLMLIVVGIVDAVLYRIDGNLELLIVSVACLMSGLIVALAGSIRKDLHDRMTAIENLLHLRCRIDRLCNH
jgi:hypothetical protein